MSGAMATNLLSLILPRAEELDAIMPMIGKIVANILRLGMLTRWSRKPKPPDWVHLGKFR